MDFLKIIFQPKSLTSFLVVIGTIFIMISGVTLEISEATSSFFLSWGTLILIIGLVGWAFFIIPAIIRNIKGLQGNIYKPKAKISEHYYTINFNNYIDNKQEMRNDIFLKVYTMHPFSVFHQKLNHYLFKHKIRPQELMQHLLIGYHQIL